VAVGLVVALTAILPVGVLAQSGPGTVAPTDIERRWQLLEYRDADGRFPEAVPPGVSITFLPFSGIIKGDSACGSYEARYSPTRRSISIEPPAVEAVACDPAAQAVDDAFLAALSGAASLSLEGDILSVYDVIDQPLLTFTSAQIPQDPTIARWSLARVGAADGSVEQIRGVSPEIEFLRGGGDRTARTGRVVGNTGCGSFLGSYRTFDSTIRITDVDYRLNDCTEEITLQAEDFIQTLSEITDFDVLPAGLALEDESGVTRLALVPRVELGSRIWTPTQIVEGEGRTGLETNLETSAVQFFGGEVEGRSFCRAFTGRSIGSGLALSADGIKLVKGACSRKKGDEGASPKDVENAFIRAIRATGSHALRGDELELYDSEGNPVMRLQPQAELVGPTWVLDKYDVRPGRRGGLFRAIEGSEPTATFTSIEVVQGDTGAVLSGDVNDYTAEFETPGAAQIVIAPPSVGIPRACRGSRSNSPECRQQRNFLGLLARSDGYIVREGELRLLEGQNPVLWFRPESFDEDDL
jgi:heat shock protein HslJ